MNKKILFSIILGILVLTGCPSGHAFAQLEPYAQGAPHVGDYKSIVYSIEYAAGFIFGAVAVICFVLAGILFLTAGGSPEKIGAARSAFIWGVVGVVVGIIAFSIIAIVETIIR